VREAGRGGLQQSLQWDMGSLIRTIASRFLNVPFAYLPFFLSAPANKKKPGACGTGLDQST